MTSRKIKRKMIATTIQTSVKLATSISDQRKSRATTLRISLSRAPKKRLLPKLTTTITQLTKQPAKSIIAQVTKAGWKIGFLKTTSVITFETLNQMELVYKYETKILTEEDLLIARVVKTKSYLKEDANT